MSPTLLYATVVGLATKLADSKLYEQHSTSAATTSTLDQAWAINDWIVTVRRELHTQPEILYELNKTSAAVRRRLDDLGIPYEHSIAKTGIVATLGTGSPPCVALRADMDALPIYEADRSCPYKSETDGRMHACGHDAHTAMLLAAARLLKAREASIPGTIKLVFQPAEEGGAGGLAMVQAGVLQAHPKIERMFALHVWPSLPAGSIATRSGTIMAAAGFFHATFVGKGGHAAMPHTTTDPFTCAATALHGLQTIVARNLSPREAGVVSTTLVRGGSAYNIIPDSVEIGGTLRSLSKPGYRYIDERLQAVLQGAASTTGCTLELTRTGFDAECLSATVVDGMTGGCTFPPTVNAPSAASIATEAAHALLGEGNERVVTAEPTMGGEDFAYFLEHVPGAMVFLGIGNATLGTDTNLHSPRFRMDESQLHLGAALHVEMALRSLARPVGEREASPCIATDEELAADGAAAHAQCEQGEQAVDD